MTGRQPKIIAAVGSALAAVVLMVVIVAASRHSGPQRPVVAIPPARPQPIITLRPIPSPTVPPYQWFSGRPYTGPRPVLAVKIDNVEPARPQVGIGAADVVYVEQVEAGLTRLLAIYSSTIPATVGPVRSARTNDLELLAEYGRPVLAFSGANAGVAADVAAAKVVDASADILSGYFFRDTSRAAPHNLFLSPAPLLTAHPSSAARDVGFRFGLETAPGASATTVGITYPSASYVWTYFPATHRYLLALDSYADMLADGSRVGATNVLVQYVTVRADKYVDVLGSPTPYNVTTGRGTGVLYRDGRAISLTWSRPSPTSPTTFLTAAGARVHLGVGQTWVMLVPRTIRAVSS